jgi:hypothetical protein
MLQSKFFVIVPLLEPKENKFRAIRLPELKDTTDEFEKSVGLWERSPQGKLKYQYEHGNVLIPDEHKTIKDHMRGVKPTINNTELLTIFSSDVVSLLKKTFSKFQINPDLVKKLVEVEKLAVINLTKAKNPKTNEVTLNSSFKLPAPTKEIAKKTTSKGLEKTSRTPYLKAVKTLKKSKK